VRPIAVLNVPDVCQVENFISAAALMQAQKSTARGFETPISTTTTSC
jgi:hypothetical protein